MKKGGTVVPPSNFQFVNDQKPMNTEKLTKNPRGRAHDARARAYENKIVLNVLIACEESQAECREFRLLGHNAYSCDIQSCKKKGNPAWHIKADVTPLLQGQTSFTTQDGKKHKVSHWDLIIAHPPCTYLCKVGSLHLYKNPDTNHDVLGLKKDFNWDRYQKLKAAREFFYKCLQAKAPYLAVENPIPMKLAQLPRPTTYACPSWFGVKYTKKTLYWLRGLPPLMAEFVYSNATEFVKASRGKYRSRTFPQMAQAIAKQWSEAIIEDIKSGRYQPTYKPPHRKPQDDNNRPSN